MLKRWQVSFDNSIKYTSDLSECKIYTTLFFIVFQVRLGNSLNKWINIMPDSTIPSLPLRSASYCTTHHFDICLEEGQVYIRAKNEHTAKLTGRRHNNSKPI